MSVTVDVGSEVGRVALGRDPAADLARLVLKAEGVTAALVSIAFVSKRRIAALNREHLGRTGPTDVIAFGFRRATGDDPVVGDVYISPDMARINAREHGSRLREELARLVVHGVLHVLGYDHPEDESRQRSEMWSRQETLLRRHFKGSSR
jgi:probable rRNA maturation factor